MSLVEQELLTSVHPYFFSVAQTLVFSVVFYRSLLKLLFFCHCVACPSSIYRFCLPFVLPVLLRFTDSANPFVLPVLLRFTDSVYPLCCLSFFDLQILLTPLCRPFFFDLQILLTLCVACPSIYRFCLPLCVACPSSIYRFCLPLCVACPSSIYRFCLPFVLPVLLRFTDSVYPLCCLSFFDLQILLTPLVSSNSSW